MSSITAKAEKFDLHDTLNDALNHLRAAKDNLGEDAHEAMEKASAAVINAAQALLDDAKEQSVAVAKGFGKEVREHPIATAAAVTAAAAAVIGLLATRKKSHKL